MNYRYNTTRAGAAVLSCATLAVLFAASIPAVHAAQAAPPAKAAAEVVKPTALWDFGTVKDGVIANSVPDGSPLKFFTWNNPPQPTPLPGVGVRVAHGSSVEGPIKDMPGLSDGKPWSLDIDFTIEDKPDGYCGGMFQSMDYLKAGLRVVLGNNMKLTTEIYHADGKGTYLSSTSPLEIGKPYKARVTFDATKATLYLNGELDATLDTAPPAPFSGACQIGVAGGNKYNFNGIINRVAIYPGTKAPAK